MKKLVLIATLPLLLASTGLFAQDTLPKFTVKNVGNNRIIIGWTNTFETIKQISIQRSFDSVSGYRSILTVADPTSPQNGYVDTKAPNDHMFYRLYILLDKGVYLFSDAKKPVLDTTKSVAFNPDFSLPKKDSLLLIENQTPGKPKLEVFRPSKFVYTHKAGYVRVALPTDPDKKYDLKFYEDDETFLFELKDIKQRVFHLDKTNFYHAGWFRFEIYEDDKLLEKHKFYLSKDF